MRLVRSRLRLGERQSGHDYVDPLEDIVREPAFMRRIGAPIVVDATGVWCPSIAIAAVASTSTCHLPVREPRGAGDVFTQCRYSGAHLTADLTRQFRNTQTHATI